jgi:hypothetical protein
MEHVVLVSAIQSNDSGAGTVVLQRRESEASYGLELYTAKVLR